MAKTKGHIDSKIVHGLRGVLDFYPRGNETIIRSWPKNKGNSQTPNSIPWQQVFYCFHIHWGGEWIGGPPEVHPSLLGDRWVPRDYVMWLYFGKSPMPAGHIRDTREPWPPPCPDPLGRFAVFNRPIGGYSIFQGVYLYFSRHPEGHAVCWVTYDRPWYHLTHRSNRRGKYDSGAEIIPARGHYYRSGASINHTQWGTNMTRFHRQLNRPFYFFFVPFTGAWKHTISMSSWYVCMVKPGPTGGEWGATLDGPYPLSKYHLDYPDRPLA